MEQTVILAIRQDGEKYMKLYFGESGIDMSRMFYVMWERTISKVFEMNKTI